MKTEGKAPGNKGKRFWDVEGAALISVLRHLARQKRSDVFTLHFPQLQGCEVHCRQQQQQQRLLGSSGCKPDTNGLRRPLVKSPRSQLKSAAAPRKQTEMWIMDRTYKQEHAYTNIDTHIQNIRHIMIWPKHHFLYKACQRLLWLVDLSRRQEVGGTASLTVRWRDDCSPQREEGVHVLSSQGHRPAS